MERHRWTIKVINTLGELMMECDSAAAIEGAKMTPQEREKLRELMKKARNYVLKGIGSTMI